MVFMMGKFPAEVDLFAMFVSEAKLNIYLMMNELNYKRQMMFVLAILNYPLTSFISFDVVNIKFD